MKGPGALLSAPMSATELSEVKNKRVLSTDYKNCSDDFLLTGDQKNYQRQFYYIYNSRLAALKPRVEKTAIQKYGSESLVKNLCDLDALAAREETEAANEDKVGEPKKVVVIGTLFKIQSLKPDILKELSEDQGLTPQPHHATYVSDQDELVLEDNNARIRLIFDTAAVANGYQVSTLATGVVCGVYGREIRTGKGKGTTGGKFLVEDVIFPELAPQTKLEPLKEDRLIAFASGFELSGTSCEILSSLELAVAWIVGDAGEMSDQAFNSTIERLILAGNSLCEETRNKSSMNKARYLTKDEDAASIGAVNSLDEILASLCVSLNVDLMSGEYDPANQIMPQQPLHTCLFPQSAPYPTLQTVTNPYMFEIGGRTILGTSGQNIDDILRNTSMPGGPLQALENLLRWSHLAPTCPDTLGCFPFQEKDPFIMKLRPHVLFAANQKKFESKVVVFDDGEKTLILSIPKFSLTSELCLLNLKTLECQQISFDPHFEQNDDDKGANSPEPEK